MSYPPFTVPEVIFVGHSPSKNFPQTNEQAFIGTRSGDVLAAWCVAMKIHHYSLTNASQTPGKRPSKTDLELLKAVVKPHLCVVALGEQASKALRDINVEHFKLPHPSGLNRKLNDKELVASKLERCRAYVMSKILSALASASTIYHYTT